MSRVEENISKKGNEIGYSGLELADYLQPINSMKIERILKLFIIRNRMVPIPNNFSKSEIKTKCYCGEIEDL